MPKQNSSNDSVRSDRKLAKALREARLLLECESDNKLARAAPQGIEAAVTQYDRALAEFCGLTKELYSDQHDTLREKIRARPLVWHSYRRMEAFGHQRKNRLCPGPEYSPRTEPDPDADARFLTEIGPLLLIETDAG
jgi:hypothetical protein